MPKAQESERRTSLRVPKNTYDRIIAECARRPGKVSANTWILEAIAEKLERTDNVEDE